MSGTKDRRQKLLGQSPATLNGIDYVVVSRRHRTGIEVHFLTAAPLSDTATTATITGGQTIPSVAVTSMDWSDDPAGRPLLTLHVAAPGDLSTYTLSLTNSALDPFFSEFPFAFFAGAASPLDCKAPATAPAPPAANVPPIDYLAKDFLSFREALSDFSTLEYPAWQERSEADFGVMFMEALCALADDLSYQQDRIAAEAYLATATERLSVVRHARLVGYEPQPALAASVQLQFTVNTGTSSVAAGLVVSATAPDGTPIYFETGMGLADTVQYKTSPLWNAITPYWLDDSAQVLQDGATEMWVATHGLGLATGVSLLLDTTPAELGLPNIRDLVEIKSTEEQTDQLYNQPITHIVFQSPLRQQHDLSVTAVKGNVVPATQGRRYSESFSIGGGQAGVPPALVRTGPNQTVQYLYTLGNAPLTWLATGAGAWAPEIQLTQQLLAGSTASPAWTWYRSLLDVPEFAMGYTIDPVRYAALPTDLSGGVNQLDYDGAAGDTLRFGDGDFGEIPPLSTVFNVIYRAGGGSVGNVAADAITTVDPTQPLAALVNAVDNPFPAQGGEDAESLDTVRRLAPYAYQATQNAVLPADYGAAAETLAWVERSGCTVRSTGSWLTAFTTAEPATTEQPTDDQIRELTAVLDRYRVAGSESFVLRPEYVSLDLRIMVTASPDAYNANVRAAVVQTLSTQILPNGNAAFFAPGQFNFGQPLERSALEAAIQSALGVAGITSIRYRPAGSTAGYVEMTDEVKVGANGIIRVNNDQSQPGSGSIAVIVAGGK
jgi:hypothetical protein